MDYMHFCVAGFNSRWAHQGEAGFGLAADVLRSADPGERNAEGLRIGLGQRGVHLRQRAVRDAAKPLVRTLRSVMRC